MSDFDALVNELGTMAKSMQENDPMAGNTPAMKKKKMAHKIGVSPVTMKKSGKMAMSDDKMPMGKKADKKIMDASEDMDDEDDEDMMEKAQEGMDDEDDGMDMGKALEVTLADGRTVSAIDASAVLRDLQARNTQLEAKIEDMQKAFGSVVDVVKGLISARDEQQSMLKALSVGQSSGRGRATMVSIVEKNLAPAVGGAQAAQANQGITANQLMMKARSLCAEGKLGWEALPRIEAFQGRGQIAPPDLLVNFPALLTPLGQ